MKKGSLGKLFDNNKFLMGFSLVIAVLCWILVAMSTSQTMEGTIRDVPVDLSLVQEALAEMNLSIIEGTNQTVDVYVSGPRTVVGQLKQEDVRVTAQLSGISEAGPYDLRLTATETSGGFDVLRFSPSTVRVRLDALDGRSFRVEAITKGVSTPPDYMTEAEVISPASIYVTGPVSELSRIDKAVIELDLEEPLTRSYSDRLPVRLLDISGEEIDPEEHYLSLDSDEVDLTIRVLRLKTLPLVVGFMHPPTGFPLDELKELMTISTESVEVAGLTNIIDNYTQHVVGYVDIRDLTIDNSEFQFDLTMPTEQLTNMSDVTTVKVEFDSFYWDEVSLNLSEFQLLNEPAGYEVELVTSALYGVRFVGDESLIAELSAADIVVEIDLAEREITAGQSPISVPVKISAPAKGLVWAVGEHTAVIRVSER